MTNDLREKIVSMLADGVPLKEIKQQTGVPIRRLRGMVGQDSTSLRMGHVDTCPTCRHRVVMPCLKCALQERKEITELAENEDPFYSSTLAEKEMIRLREIQLIKDIPENERFRGLLTHGLDQASYETLDELSMQINLLCHTQYTSDDKFVAAERVSKIITDIMIPKDVKSI